MHICVTRRNELVSIKKSLETPLCVNYVLFEMHKQIAIESTNVYCLKLYYKIFMDYHMPLSRTYTEFSDQTGINPTLH